MFILSLLLFYFKYIMNIIIFIYVIIFTNKFYYFYFNNFYNYVHVFVLRVINVVYNNVFLVLTTSLTLIIYLLL